MQPFPHQLTLQQFLQPIETLESTGSEKSPRKSKSNDRCIDLLDGKISTVILHSLLDLYVGQPLPCPQLLLFEVSFDWMGFLARRLLAFHTSNSSVSWKVKLHFQVGSTQRKMRKKYERSVCGCFLWETNQTKRPRKQERKTILLPKNVKAY